MALTMREAQMKVDRWIDQFEEGYWPPLSMFASLVEEVGELGREINNLEGLKIKRSESNSDLEVEVGDILFSLVCITNRYKIDLENAFLSTMAKYSKRDEKRWTRKLG
jgi:NTP pyrophosphatase (non-canonical NTP hydrolase)